MSFKRHEKRIYVPSRMVSGGLGKPLFLLGDWVERGTSRVVVFSVLTYHES